MMPKGPFLLEGKSYDGEQLLAYCDKAKTDPVIPEWKKEVLAFIKTFLGNASEGILQHTSGTTGDPNRHMLDRESMVLSARRTLEFFQLEKGQRVLLCLPIRYVAGKMMVVRALAGRLNLFLSEPTSRPLRDLEEQIEFAAMVPLQVHESFQHGDDFSRVSTLLIGGGELRHSLRKGLRLLHRTAVYESFGMTETYTHFALKRLNGDQPEEAFRIMDGVTIDQDHRNCLVVDLKGITSGPITTNDLVELYDDRRYFKWLGRYDHVINSGGIKIIPEFLEERIHRLIGMECLVLSEPDDRLGSKLVLMVETPEENPDMHKWQTILRDNLSPHELPRRIVNTSEIPRNPSMKPDRLESRRKIAGH